MLVPVKPGQQRLAREADDFSALVGGMLASSKCQPGWRAFDAHKKI
jgi:hypothetical protein